MSNGTTTTKNGNGKGFKVKFTWPGLAALAGLLGFLLVGLSFIVFPKESQMSVENRGMIIENQKADIRMEGCINNLKEQMDKMEKNAKDQRDRIEKKLDKLLDKEK